MIKYNTKWQTKFQSVNKRLYTVNICVYGYSGSIISMTADTDPLQLEEVDDKDLLNVIRYTTGYLNILADDSINVADIFPTNSITERYVEILEGSTVIFRGYVQVQEFDREGNYAATGNPPTAVSIPLISPLGLVSDIKFDKEASPTDYTLFAVMKKCLNKMGGTNGSNLTPYTYVYFPQVVSGNPVLKRLMMSSLVISPYSDKNTHNSSTTTDECFDAQTLEYFIEGLCRCFGCMVHDTPDAIVFTKFDYTGSYVRYDIDGNTATINQPSSRTLAPDVVFDKGINISQIAPLRQLTCSFDGEREKSLTMNFQHCRRTRGTDNAYSRNLAVNNPIMSSEISAPYLLTSCIINENGVPSQRGTYLLAYGEDDNMREMAVFNFETDATGGHNWAANDMLLRTTFNGYFGTSMKLTIKFEWGVNMNLECPKTYSPSVTKYLYMTIKNGSKYLNENNQWVTTRYNWHITSDVLVHENGDFTVSIPSTGMETIPIEVTFYEYDIREFFQTFTCLAITELTLKGEAADPVTEYITEGENPAEYKVQGNGIDEQDISIAFACYGQRNSHMLFPNVSFSNPQYPYIFRKRQQVKVTYQGTLGDDYNYELYIRQTTWKGTAMKVIASSYSADYEQTTLTLQEI